jgi:hypothetical protein
MMAMVDSVTLAGKIFIQEEDARTWLYPNPEPGLALNTQWDTLQCLRRDYGNVVCHNQATWWMDLGGNGAFNDPSIWDNNRILTDSCKDTITNEVAYCPEVALIYDEDTFFWLKSDSLGLNADNGYRQRSVFQGLGAPVGYYYIDDLDKLPSSVKLIVFVNTWRVSESEEAKINALKSNGRTLLWLYAPGYVNETGLSLNRMQLLTGIPVRRNTTSISATVSITNATHPITSGLVGHQFSSTDRISPTFHGINTGANTTTLGTYVANSLPALIIRDFTQWKSIFCGGVYLSVPILRGIAKYAGVNLLVDRGDLYAEDAVQYNGRYLYAYARGHSGNRTFHLTSDGAVAQPQPELVQNCGFEAYTGAMPTSGSGVWVSPVYGTLPACTVTMAHHHSGTNACQTGAFTSAAGQYSTVMAQTIPVQQGHSYNVSCWVYVDNLIASGAARGDYIKVGFNPDPYNSDAKSFWLAQGSDVSVPAGVWTHYSTVYTQNGPSGMMGIFLAVYGGYSVNNIVLDNFSVKDTASAAPPPSGTSLWDITEMTTGRTIGTGINSWTDYFGQNQQMIYKVAPHD